MHSGTIRRVTITDLETPIREMEAKLADPADPDDTNRGTRYAKSPVETAVRHRSARRKHQRDLESFVGFALVGRAGEMAPDPTAEAVAPLGSLVLDVVTILRNSHSKKSAPTIDSLARVYALPLGETAP